MPFSCRLANKQKRNKVNGKMHRVNEEKREKEKNA